MLWRKVLARKPEVAVAVVCCERGVECRCSILLGLFEQLRLSAEISSGCGCFWRSFFFVGDNR